MRARRLAPALLAAATVLAALAAASARASAEPPDPCVLITAKDAAVVFGDTAPARAKPRTAGAVRSCTYSVGRASLTVRTRALASAGAFSAATRALRGGVLPIAGLAEAYSTVAGSEILLWKDGVEITLSFGGVSPVFATLTSLASTALGRV